MKNCTQLYFLTTFLINSGLWKAPGLEYDPDFNDEDICYHGYGYRDCNVERDMVYQV